MILLNKGFYQPNNFTEQLFSETMNEADVKLVLILRTNKINFLMIEKKGSFMNNEGKRPNVPISTSFCDFDIRKVERIKKTMLSILDLKWKIVYLYSNICFRRYQVEN